MMIATPPASGIAICRSRTADSCGLIAPGVEVTDIGSALQDDSAVARIAIAFAYRIVERGLRHAERCGGIHAAKVVPGGEGFQLVGSERRLATEHRVQPQQEAEQAIRDVHDPG